MTEDRDLRIDLKIAAALVADSGIFDGEYYRSKKSGITGLSPIEDYLVQGWREGLEPSADFEGKWLYPYLASAGLSDPPALTYATLTKARLPTYSTQAAAERVAKVVRNSELFNAKYYTAQADVPGNLDPALHYILVGERIGLRPSARFNPVYYRKRYPDLEFSPVCLLQHYLRAGKREGRRPISFAEELTFDTTQIESTRETILLITHQASRTGAAVLAYNIAKRLSARYNIVTLVLAAGELLPEFKAYGKAVVGPLSPEAAWSAIEAEYIVSRLNEVYRIKFAIVNSIDSHTMLKPLHCTMIPSITLVHEFAAHARAQGHPPGEMGRWLEWTNEIVFSAEIVARSVRDEYPHLDARPVHILPQGPCELPERNLASRQSFENVINGFVQATLAEGGDATVILGCGTVYARKGVDLFIACAERAIAIAPDRHFRFVWIGDGYNPSTDKYSQHLQQQIERARLSRIVTILDAMPNLEGAYAAADFFFLSSRLDPLPNVAIDSALRGIPIVCFDQTGGIAELLAADEVTAAGVAPYLDVNAAAKIITELANDKPRRAEISRATKRLATATFDMARYVERLDELGRKSEQIMMQRQEDFRTIREDSAFDTSMFLNPDTVEATRDEAIRLFLARSEALSTSVQPTANFYFRRPCAGFHPQIYVREKPGQLDETAVNPLAHFIRCGRPKGPWTHDVITPEIADEKIPAVDLRIAIHGHFFYPELLKDFIGKLSTNSTKCDLLISTNNESKAAELRKATKHYDGGKVIVSTFPNRGRDIGPLFTGFAQQITEYDIIGHFHSKRSPHAGWKLGENWREFLWQSLLGGFYPMMDAAVCRFAKDQHTGLIFADDPHLSDWDQNRQIAESLARRIGYTEPLPPYFDFPLGTMFWARTRALKPLLSLGLKWQDYPEEPVALDGTLLHAIERLLPFAIRHAGFSYATTYVRGMTW